jgi:uncharacterized Tic20 family protein
MTNPVIPPQSPHDTRPEPTQEERTAAMLAHVLSMFAGFVAPLVIYFVKRRESRFVAFHALQAFFWHLGLMVTMFGTFIAFAITMFTTRWIRGPLPFRGHDAGPPPAFFLGMFVIWAAMMSSLFVSMGFAVYLGVQANAGRWTRYPIIGSLVARIGCFAQAKTNAGRRS